MSLRFTTKSIHAKLDDLTISSPPVELQELTSPKVMPGSTKSQLSKSLANVSSYIDKPPSPIAFASLDMAQLRDEHPEPPLLATSVGKDLDGRIIPSSSTISLLSLSNNSHSNSTSNFAAGVPSNITNFVGNPANIADLQFSSNKLTQTFTPNSIERGNSFSNLRSRNSFNHLGQQRLQPYQKLTSPAMVGGPEFASISSPQNIPLKRNFSSLFTPSSPNLDPTSVANSPSGFWLNSQTPPASSSSIGVYRSSNAHFSSIAGMTPMSGISEPARVQEEQGSQNLVSKHINIQRSGGDSPILNPVQTPLEDGPMTPLYLNTDPNSYFVLSNSQPGYLKTNVAYGFNTEKIDEKDDYEMELGEAD